MDYNCGKFKKPKISLYYENEEPYMSLSGETTVKYSDNFHENIIVNIHKIKLSDLRLSLNDIYGTRKCVIEIPIIPTKDEFFNFVVNEDRKPMTQKEIEKVLGYKIEIVK